MFSHPDHHLRYVWQPDHRAAVRRSDLRRSTRRPGRRMKPDDQG